VSSHDTTQLFIEDFRDLASIDLSQFRAAPAFSVEIVPRAGGAGRLLRLADASLGTAIDFPWWDSPDLELGRWTLDDIPLGTLEEPYSDADQCWRILVWQVNGVVYIAAGSADEEGLYDTFLSVPGEEYRAAWGGLISSLKL
jgi:hypothetical protein